MATDKKNKSGRRNRKQAAPMLFSKENYLIMFSGGFLIFLGFLFMYLDGQINGFISLYVSPLFILAGFITFGVGIVRKNPQLSEDNQSPQS